MAPKRGGRAAAGSAKQLSKRLQSKGFEQNTQDPDEPRQPVCLGVLWRSLAYCSMLDVDAWSQTIQATLIQNYSVLSPAWADVFVPDRHLTLLLPPLQQYLDDSNGQSLVQLWQGHSFKTRMQLACSLASQQRTAADAAWVVLDALPCTAAGLLDRVKVAAAAYLHAKRRLCAAKGTADPPDIIDVRKGIDSITSQWLRAHWLLMKALAHCRTQTSLTCWHISRYVNSLADATKKLPDDPLMMRLLWMKDYADMRKWPDLLSLCSRCYLGSHLLSPPCKTHDKYTLATAYNTALATYKVVGPEHEDAVAAVAAALHLDQGRWVPLLMAGGVLGTAVMGPLMPLGGKEEATAYCQTYGVFWWEDHEMWKSLNKVKAPASTSPTVEWLLAAAGLSELSTPLDTSRLAVLCYNFGMYEAAYDYVSGDVVDEMNRAYGTIRYSTGRVREPAERTALLRGELCMLSCLAAASVNLPPVDAGYQCWAGVEAMWMTRTQIDLKGRLVDCATMLHDMASKLLSTCQSVSQSDWLSDSLAWPGELSHALATLAELQPARVRWLWQAGEIKLAKDLAADLQRQQLQQQQQAQQTQVTLAAAHNSSSSSRSSRSRLLNPGQILHDSEAVHSMVDFLNQQSLEAARSKGSKGGLTMAAATSSSSSRAAGVALMSGAKGSRAVINYAPYQELETFLQILKGTFERAQPGAMQQAEQWLLTAVPAAEKQQQNHRAHQQELTQASKLVDMRGQQEQQQGYDAATALATGPGDSTAVCSSSRGDSVPGASTKGVVSAAAAVSDNLCLEQPLQEKQQQELIQSAELMGTHGQQQQQSDTATVLDTVPGSSTAAGSSSRNSSFCQGGSGSGASLGSTGSIAGPPSGAQCQPAADIKAAVLSTTATCTSARAAAAAVEADTQFKFVFGSASQSGFAFSSSGSSSFEDTHAGQGKGQVHLPFKPAPRISSNQSYYCRVCDGAADSWCGHRQGTHLQTPEQQQPAAVSGVELRDGMLHMNYLKEQESSSTAGGADAHQPAAAAAAAPGGAAALLGSGMRGESLGAAADIAAASSGHAVAAADYSSSSGPAAVHASNVNNHSISSLAHPAVPPADAAVEAQTAAAPAQRAPFATAEKQPLLPQQPPQQVEQPHTQEQQSCQRADSGPVAAVPTEKACATCGKSDLKLSRCSGCAAVGVYVVYCSRECQGKHWKAGHKRVCGARRQQQQG